MPAARRLLLLTCLAALAGAGCGDDDGGDGIQAAAAPEATATEPLGREGQATAALESFLQALADRDAAAACELLSSRGVSIVEEGALIGSPSGGGECEEVVLESYARTDPGVLDEFEVLSFMHSTDGSIRLVFRNADSPRVGGPATAAVVRKERGAWKVDSARIPG